AAVGVVQRIARAEIALLVAAHGAWTAGIPVAVRRQRRGVAVGFAERELAVDLEAPAPRHPDVLQEVERRDVVLDLAARGRRAHVRAHARAESREDRPVERHELPARGELEALHLSAEEIARAVDRER